MENQDKIELEKLKIRFDQLLVEKNLFEKNKKLEIEQLKKEVELEKLKKSSQRSIIQKGILVALIGLIATLCGTLIDGFNSKKAEQEKFYTGLVNKAFEKESPEEIAEYLEVLISSKALNSEMTKQLKKVLFREDVANHPLILDEMKKSEYSNLEIPFAIRNSFDCSYSMKDSNLVISISNLYLAQLKTRPFYPTIIKGVKVFLYVNYVSQEWEVLYESNTHHINIIFDNEFTYKEKQIDFKIPLGEIEKADDYFIGLEILELYDGALGTSNTRTNINVKIE